MGLELPIPMKKLTSLGWEAPLTQEELKEVFNKEEEEYSEEEDAHLMPAEKSVNQSSTNMSQAFKTSQNCGLIDTKDTQLLTG
ncbi:hypothetical protein NDU88_001109 [Pleurodeles waltl]|uniref:Uncharacterized protein n=1 Tax=Pleurodeles waltl TaxID=8319 RepID=A0AAV7URW0_PLEWA|nr:hypothetical protein NDU88_001109 [Pleurodeles waltl]